MKKIRVLFWVLGLMACEEKIDPTLQMSITRGKEIYSDFCVQCHLPDGKGVPNAFPPLALSDFIDTQLEASIAGLKYGMQGAIVVNGETYNGNMPAQGLDDTEIADVMNYIRNSWGNQYRKLVTPSDVAQISKSEPWKKNLISKKYILLAWAQLLGFMGV